MGSFVNGVGRTNICFGCHQNIAKRDYGKSADADTEHPENLQVTNTATAPNYVPEFEGRGPANMFLNSPHARFSGNIVPNSLGNYDLEDTTGNENGNASKYKSKFQGSNCWQSPTSNSPAATMIVGGEIHEIKTKADCENLYGAGSWRPQLISGVAATQGTCSTCHNVHNSRFYNEQKEAAFWKVCTDCHNKSLTTIKHPTGPGTPLGDLVGTAEAWEACVTCHMPKATSSGFPMHLWRINTNADYRTFPTATEFGIGATATKKIANAAADGTYTNAVWVDVDYACGQCHGGSFGPDAIQNGAPYMDKASLSLVSKNMHNNPGPNVSFTTDINHYTVTLTDTSTDDRRFPANAITVKWGDGTSSTGNAGDVFSHTYARPRRYRIVYSVIDSNGVSIIKRERVTLTRTP
jgi:predicted CXXCH cytochrome family protein